MYRACVTALLPLLGAELHARPTADWVRSAVIYEINTRTFSAKGDFRGVEARLPELEKLGVTILWLMPIHPIGEVKRKGTFGSPYSIRDYYAIEPSYGTATDLKSLVHAAHARGFKIIIDIVANHTSWDSVLMKHPEFYKHDAQGNVISPNPGWDDVAGLDYGNRAVRTYMIDMLKYWLREFDLDGFRCDVAFLPPADFWEDARRDLEKVKPDIVMLAEAHEPALMVNAFDLDYAWPFYKTLAAVFTGGAPATALRESWEQERARFPKGALEMRFTDNHDERRAIARFGERGALAAAALVFTMDGVPLLYNGMEVGDTAESAGGALFERLSVFWGSAGFRPEYPKFFAQTIALRRAHAALQQGETHWIGNSDAARIVTFTRTGGGEEFLIAVNCSNQPFVGTVESGRGFEEVTPGATPLPALSLDAWGFRIFKKAGEPWTAGELIKPETLAAEMTKDGRVVLHVGFLALYKGAHIAGSQYAGPGSKPAGLDALRAAVKAAPHDREIVIYCGCCPWDHCPNIRPAYALLRELGFSHIRVLMIPENMHTDWVAKGYPVSR